MDEEFDPQAFISGTDTTATEAPPEQPQAPALPTVTPSLSTFYYPSTPEDTRAKGLSYSMEGGIHGGGRFGDVDLRNHTLEQFLDKKSPFVAVAMKGEPTGDEFMTTILGHTVLAKNVDTGGGLKDGQIDFATSNPELARSGIQHGPFDPQAFIKRQDVPDIHAFMEPAPADTPEAETTDQEPSVGEKIGKAISGFGEAIASHQAPKLNLTAPTYQPPAIPQVPQPQSQVIPGQGMIGAAIPTALPTPAPSLMPDNGRPIPGQFFRNLGIAAGQTGGELKQMVNAPVELAQQAMNPRLSVPSRLAAAAGVVASAAQLDPLVPRGAVRTGEVPVPDSFQPQVAPQAQATLVQPQQPQGLPVKAASVQGLKNPPRERHPIAASAIQLEDGTRFTAPTHAQAMEAAGIPDDAKITVVDEAKALFRVNTKDGRTFNLRSGFTDRAGNFLDPYEARKAAEAHKQLTEGAIEHGDEKTALGSEDLATPPTQPPQGPPPQNPPTAPALPEDLNPVPGSGKFRRSYRVDKSMGDQMEGIGAARESGYLRAELQSRNMLHELSPRQEADLGTLLVSDRLKTVNPNHPQVIFDSVARGIESDPAIAKALDYYKKEIKPEIEALRKRAGLSAKAAAGKQAGFISLIVKNPEPLVPGQGGIQRTGNLGRTTRFARLAEGQAKEYSTNLRDILAESYSEALKKARVREFYDSTIKKGITEDGTYEELPPQLQHDLTAATQPELNQMPIQSNPNFGLASKLGDLLRTAGRGYQRVVTGLALTANPAELMNHMRRQLNLVAAKPPVGMGIMARMEALLPYFGPKLGAFKRVVMDDMSTPQNQSILKDIFDAGGGSSRSFGERYESHIPGLRQVQKGTQKLLFGVPRGRGVGGWDLRMRVQLEKMRRSVEGNVDPQRIREFANQIGQYGSQTNWFIRGLRTINPYAATSVPMRITELKTLFGEAGFKGEPLSRKALHTAETILRGTGGTLLAMASANYLLSGKWPWQNDKGHEFDINMGVKDKKGKTIYLKTRAFAPEMSRPISTLSVPDVLRERKAQHPQYVAAAMTGPANQALSLVSSPGLNVALTAATGKVPYLLKRPGEGVEFMDVAKLKKGEAAKGVSRGGRQLLMALSSINPAGERLASQHEEDAPGALGYIEEPIPGIRPFGDIFSTSYESRSVGGYSTGAPGRGGGGRSSGRGTGGR